MTNPTNPFNWQMPTASDLVTDLPADFEVFGQAVATSMADLLGGTTGQVLSKASNTNMDFTWVTTDDANAIQNSIVDAKGDLIAASANDTPARLAVGANGETLVADSAATTGLRYSATPSASNPVLNSSMQVWQRGTSFSIAASAGYTYTADRWCMTSSANQATTISRQATGDTTNLPNIQYAMRFQRNSGQTGVAGLYNFSSFESVNSIPFAGKTVTLSFYARAGANYSATSSVLGVGLNTGTGTDQAFFSMTGATNAILSNATLTTTWQRFTFSGTVAATVTQIAPYFIFTPTGTASTNDYYEVTGVQIDIGSVALPFRTYAATIQGELAACQRYFVKFGDTNQNYGVMSWGQAYSSTHVMSFVPLPVTMRVKPSSISFSNLRVNDWINYISVTTMAIEDNYTTPQLLALDATVTGATTKIPYTLGQDNNSGGKLEVSAEL